MCAKRLHADGRVAQKIYPGTMFEYQTHFLNNLSDLHRVLKKLEQNHHAFLIRGALQSKFSPGQPHFRRLSHVVDVPHHWLCLDLDELDAPPHLEPTDPQAAVWLIKQHLPAQFHGAAFILQWSSSAGTLKAGRRVKCHLWFWLDSKHTCAELRPWAKRIGADAAIFNPVQPHYTAAPVFVPC
jgi:putative DNA primase/helicase